MKKLIVLSFLFLMPFSVFGETKIDWSNFESEADEAIERAAARTDSAFNVAEYMRTFDSLIAETHVDFTKKYKLKIASLISRERADRQLEVEAVVEVIAQKYAQLVVAALDNDVDRIDKLRKQLELLRIQLVDAIVRLRNIKAKPTD